MSQENHRIRLSAVVVTLNAESQIEKCLKSLTFADDIVMVDSGSIDRTLAIAEANGARTIVQEWLGYGPQKNFAVSRATHDWVLCLDADERVSPELRASIVSALVNPLPGVHAFFFARRNRFMGRWLKHGEGYPDWSLRLFDRRVAQWSDDPVHEKVVVEGQVSPLSGDLLHDSAETLRSYLTKQNAYTDIQAEEMFRKGRKPSLGRLLTSPILRFCKFYILRAGFLDGVPGLVHICIGCFNSFLKYAKLFEKWRTRIDPAGV